MTFFLKWLFDFQKVAWWLKRQSKLKYPTCLGKEIEFLTFHENIDEIEGAAV